VRPSGNQTLSVGISTLQVHVEQVVPTRQMAMCRDSFGGLQEVAINPRPMPRYPREGEFWVITKDLIGLWTFAAPMDGKPAPVVTGSRALADPVALSLLSALTQLGLVTDGTVA
jgi:hypothetical protein